VSAIRSPADVALPSSEPLLASHGGTGAWAVSVSAANEIDVEALYRRYGDLVLGRCCSLLGNEAEGQDAMQEVFLRIHRYKDSFRGEARPSTFLYRVATNHCLNLLRSRKRRPEDATDDLSWVADSLLDVVELRDLLDRLLVDQDERTRECVVYHFVDGMTHQQTGDLLGISDAAVRKRIARFRQDVAHLAPPWMEETP
jgi:RNA polymerase sigma-70 factor, ECF subfamily